MKEFTIYCTPEQTRKAFELGVPIKATQDHSNGNVTENLCVYGDIINEDKWGIGECTILHIPTAEQMLGWLNEKGIALDIHTYFSIGNDKIHHYQFTVTDSKRIFNGEFPSRKEATLAAIDAALDYLLNTK